MSLITKGPHEWKPPDPSYRCRYPADRSTIKNQWDLTATPAELAALDQMLATCGVPHQLGAVVTFEKPTCRPSEAPRLCPLPPVIILADSTVSVMRRMLRVKPVSAAARDQVVASPGRWCPARGTLTAWCVSAQPVSRHSTDQTRLASYMPAGVRILTASCRNSSASDTSRYSSPAPDAPLPHPPVPRHPRPGSGDGRRIRRCGWFHGLLRSSSKPGYVWMRFTAALGVAQSHRFRRCH